MVQIDSISFFDPNARKRIDEFELLRDVFIPDCIGDQCPAHIEGSGVVCGYARICVWVMKSQTSSKVDREG